MVDKLNPNLEPCAACAAGEPMSSSSLHYLKGVSTCCPVSLETYRVIVAPTTSSEGES